MPGTIYKRNKEKGKSVNMLKYNKERLSRVIKDFCIITKVSVAVLDSDFVMIVEYSDAVPK